MKPGSLATTRAVIRKRVAAPRERVFRAWTEAEHLRHWFFPGSAAPSATQVEVDLRVGGRYCITKYTPDGAIEAKVGGTYHAIQPPIAGVGPSSCVALHAHREEREELCKVHLMTSANSMSACTTVCVP